MPQIANSSEECTCKDEVKVYNEEGEEEDETKRSSENLSIDKVDLVTEGEDQKRLSISDLFRPSYDSMFGVPFADYFFPPYPGTYASAFSQDSFSSKVPFMPPSPGTFGFMPFAMRDAIGSCGLNGALGFPSAYPFHHRNGFMFGPHISALCSENLASMWANSASNQASFPPLLNPFMSPPPPPPPLTQSHLSHSAIPTSISTSSSSITPLPTSSSNNNKNITSNSMVDNIFANTISNNNNHNDLISTSCISSILSSNSPSTRSSSTNNPSFCPISTDSNETQFHNYTHNKNHSPFFSVVNGKNKSNNSIDCKNYESISNNNHNNNGSSASGNGKGKDIDNYNTTNNHNIMYVPSPLRPTPINLSNYSSLSSSITTSTTTAASVSLSLKCSSDSKEEISNQNNDRWIDNASSALASVSAIGSPTCTSSVTSSSTVPSLTNITTQSFGNFNILNTIDSISSLSSVNTPKSTVNHTINNTNNTNNTNNSTNKSNPCTDSDHYKSDLIDSRYCKSNHHKDSQRPHIKKPLNAFMLFMKEMRQKVQEECTLKESAAINQILGKKWHTLSKEEQSKYYEIAKKEKQLHIQLFPEWSARDNYAIHSKHKKRRRLGQGNCNDGSDSKMNDANNMKKCRARYGIEQMSQWCKPCRRKKKCIRFLKVDESNDGTSQTSRTNQGQSYSNNNNTIASTTTVSTGKQTSNISNKNSNINNQFDDLSDRAPSPQGPFLSDTETSNNNVLNSTDNALHHHHHHHNNNQHHHHQVSNYNRSLTSCDKISLFSNSSSNNSFRPQLDNINHSLLVDSNSNDNSNNNNNSSSINITSTINSLVEQSSISITNSTNINNSNPLTTTFSFSNNLIPSPSSAFSSLKSIASSSISSSSTSSLNNNINNNNNSSFHSNNTNNNNNKSNNTNKNNSNSNNNNKSSSHVTHMTILS